MAMICRCAGMVARLQTVLHIRTDNESNFCILGKEKYQWARAKVICTIIIRTHRLHRTFLLHYQPASFYCLNVCFFASVNDKGFLNQLSLILTVIEVRFL